MWHINSNCPQVGKFTISSTFPIFHHTRKQKNMEPTSQSYLWKLLKENPNGKSKQSLATNISGKTSNSNTKSARKGILKQKIPGNPRAISIPPNYFNNIMIISCSL
jgi:hypothetical protein